LQLGREDIEASREDGAEDVGAAMLDARRRRGAHAHEEHVEPLKLCGGEGEP
jgi:hypothetical protein